MNISNACAQFLVHCKSAISLSPHTLRAYEGDLNLFMKYFGGRKQLPTIQKEELRSYICYLRDELKFKESSIKRRLASLKLLFRWSLREKKLAVNPFDTLDERIRLPKRLPRALDRGHVMLLRKSIVSVGKSDDFDLLGNKVAIHLLLDTGIRVSELSNIRIEDVSLPNRCLTIHGKGNRQRLVYLLSSTLFRTLNRYLSMRQKLLTGSERLFITSGGLELTPPRIRASLHRIAANAGIERRLTPHMLRHTCATLWLEAGLDIRYVQKLLGHQSISTTEIYTHVSDKGLREALLRTAGGKMR